MSVRYFHEILNILHFVLSEHGKLVDGVVLELHGLSKEVVVVCGSCNVDANLL